MYRPESVPRLPGQEGGALHSEERQSPVFRDTQGTPDEGESRMLSEVLKSQCLRFATENHRRSAVAVLVSVKTNVHTFWRCTRPEISPD